MKHLFFTIIIGLFLVTACGNQNEEGKISTDLVTNPKSASQPSDKQPVITFEKTEHDFGTILQGERVAYTFHFTNTGNVPLLISSVNSSCGCTVGDFSRDPIAPGKSGTIKATYDSKGHHGFQSRTLTVVTNTNPNKTVLRLKANVKTPDQY
jgi:hypothetical protein